VKSGVERVALVVVEIAKAAAIAKLAGIAEQPTSDDTAAFHLLIGVGEINVQTFLDTR